MSYILDALKKADSERQLGEVPNIYAQPLTNNGLTDTFSFWRKPVVWLALAAVLALALMFFFVTREHAPQAPATTADNTTSSVAIASSVPPQPVASAPAAREPAPVRIAKVAAAPSSSEKKSRTPERAIPPPEFKLKTDATLSLPPEKKDKQARLANTSTAAASTMKNPASAKPATPGNNELALRDLPAQIQSEIPEVQIGGYIYSANQGESQLLVNKRLLREGDEVAPGLTLEKMLPHTAILRYKGYRYRISY